MNSDHYILRTLDLKVGFAKRIIIDNVNLQVSSGDICFLMGRNGAGKSSLLRTLSGIQSNLGGSIVYEGILLQNFHPNERAKFVSFISTHTPFINSATIYDIVSLGRIPYTGWLGNLQAIDKEIINEAIDLCGLYHMKDCEINRLSDGEKQRTMIARAIAQDTKLIIMDEPTAFLDISGRASIEKILLQITNERKKSVIMSSHDLLFIESLNSKCIVINNKKELVEFDSVNKNLDEIKNILI